MKKEEALKAVESLKTTPEPRATKGKTVDYAALAGKNFKTKK